MSESELDLDQIEALAAEATPGPWDRDEDMVIYFDPVQIDLHEHVAFGCMPGDADFITAARTLIPVMVARIRELEAEPRWTQVELDEAKVEAMQMKVEIDLARERRIDTLENLLRRVLAETWGDDISGELRAKVEEALA